MKILKIFLILSPIWIVLICMLKPTFDDWTYFTTPWSIVWNDCNLIEAFMPYAGYWRPFDMLYGWLLSFYPPAYPIANHIMVAIGHIGNAIILYHFSTKMIKTEHGRNISVLFFVLSPGILGTVTGIDTLNQTWACLSGMLSIESYMFLSGRKRILLWLICVVVATMWKENGIAFAIIGPLLAWGWEKENTKQLIKAWIKAIVICIVYFAVRYALRNDNVEIKPDYFDFSLGRRLKNFGVFLGITFIPLDYVSLYFKPLRNWFVVAVTAMLATPLILHIFWQGRTLIKSRKFIALAISILAAASPHLLTLFTAMHSYAALPIAALSIGWMADKVQSDKLLKLLTVTFAISCIFINLHHWIEAYKSGVMGDRMAQQGMDELNSHTATPVDSVFTISVYQGEPKYSSFCVIPVDAFAWGCSLLGKTYGQWPLHTEDYSIDYPSQQQIDSIAHDARSHGYKNILLVRGDSVKYYPYTLNSNATSSR